MMILMVQINSALVIAGPVSNETVSWGSFLGEIGHK